MSKKIEVQQFVQEIAMNFGRIDFLGIDQGDRMKVWRNKDFLRAVDFVNDWVLFLCGTDKMDTAEAIVTQKHNVILILHSL